MQIIAYFFWHANRIQKFLNNAKIIAEGGSKADPADVVRDGYEALMSGKDMVVSGFKNKIQVAIGSITPDSMVADKTKKQQEPVEGTNGL